MNEGKLGRLFQTVVVVALLVFGGIAILMVLPVSVSQCDGVVERWRIPDQYNGSGCATLPMEWQKIFPWNYGDDELVCLGLCDDALLPNQDQ